MCVSLFTSNKHPRRTSAVCAKGSLPAALLPPPFPRSPSKVLSLASSRVASRTSRPPLQLLSRKSYICMLYFFVCFYTGSTRYLLIILLIDASFLSFLHGPSPLPLFSLPIWTREDLARYISDSFALVPSVFWKIAATRRFPPRGIPKSPPPVPPPRLASFRVLAAGGKGKPRRQSSRNLTDT